MPTNESKTPVQHTSLLGAYEEVKRELSTLTEENKKLNGEMEELNKLVQPKGIFVCNQCHFTLTKSVLYTQSGTIGTDNEPFVERCPNDGHIMRPLTYKELAEENYKGACTQAERAIKAEQECDQLKSQLSWTTYMNADAEFVQFLKDKADEADKCACEYCIGKVKAFLEALKALGITYEPK